MPEHLIVVCGLMRTGTTLLCRMLACAQFGSPREYLHHAFPEFASFDEAAQYILSHQTGHVASMKLLPGQLWRACDFGLAKSYGGVLDGLVSAIGAHHTHYVLMTRRDHKRQAASVLRADALGRWFCPANQELHAGAIPYTPEAVARFEHLLNDYVTNERGWHDYFEARGINPLAIIYEEFTRSDDSIHTTLQAVVDHCGLTLPADYQPYIPLKKQAGSEVDAWLAQYEAEHG